MSTDSPSDVANLGATPGPDALWKETDYSQPAVAEVREFSKDPPDPTNPTFDAPKTDAPSYRRTYRGATGRPVGVINLRSNLYRSKRASLKRSQDGKTTTVIRDRSYAGLWKKNEEFQSVPDAESLPYRRSARAFRLLGNFFTSWKNMDQANQSGFIQSPTVNHGWKVRLPFLTLARSNWIALDENAREIGRMAASRQIGPYSSTVRWEGENKDVMVVERKLFGSTKITKYFSDGHKNIEKRNRKGVLTDYYDDNISQREQEAIIDWRDNVRESADLDMKAKSFYEKERAERTEREKQEQERLNEELKKKAEADELAQELREEELEKQAEADELARERLEDELEEQAEADEIAQERLDKALAEKAEAKAAKALQWLARKTARDVAKTERALARAQAQDAKDQEKLAKAAEAEAAEKKDKLAKAVAEAAEKMEARGQALIKHKQEQSEAKAKQLAAIDGFERSINALPEHRRPAAREIANKIRDTIAPSSENGARKSPIDYSDVKILDRGGVVYAQHRGQEYEIEKLQNFTDAQRAEIAARCKEGFGYDSRDRPRGYGRL